MFLLCFTIGVTTWQNQLNEYEPSESVWSESLLSAWRNLGSLATHWDNSEDSDQTGRMPKLIWVFAERTVTLLVLSCRASFVLFVCLFFFFVLFFFVVVVFFFFCFVLFISTFGRFVYDSLLSFCCVRVVLLLLYTWCILGVRVQTWAGRGFQLYRFLIIAIVVLIFCCCCFFFSNLLLMIYY